VPQAKHYELDPNNLRAAANMDFDVGKLPLKAENPNQMLDEWHQLKLLNVMSEEDITKIMASQLYQEASQDIKLQWWIQVSKSLTVGTWVDGKKVTKPSPASEIVFRYCEGNQVTI
jgi:hypothetical protein